MFTKLLLIFYLLSPLYKLDYTKDKPVLYWTSSYCFFQMCFLFFVFWVYFVCSFKCYILLLILIYHYKKKWHFAAVISINGGGSNRRKKEFATVGQVVMLTVESAYCGGSHKHHKLWKTLRRFKNVVVFSSLGRLTETAVVTATTYDRRRLDQKRRKVSAANRQFSCSVSFGWFWKWGLF